VPTTCLIDSQGRIVAAGLPAMAVDQRVDAMVKATKD
jgi:hypothetical protein